MRKVCIFMMVFIIAGSANALNLDSNTNDLPILRIGVIETAPFVIQASKQQFYGFDIATMKYICKFLKKRCEYIPLKSNTVYSAIANNTVDLAIGGVVITPTRSNYVSFSMPYMTSEGQFVGLKELSTPNLSSVLLENKKVGVVKNSAFADQIQSMNTQHLKILAFDSDNHIISAIKSGMIDLGFINQHVAQYWKHNSNGLIQLIGEHFTVGYGLAIVTNQANLELIENINDALYNYQNSSEFKNNYNAYLDEF